MSGGTIAGAGLGLGSSLMNSMAQSKIDAARTAALQSNQAQQAGLDTQIAAKNADALGLYANMPASTAATQSSLASLYAPSHGANAGSALPSAMPTSRSGAVQGAASAALGQKMAYVGQQGDARAALEAPGQAMQQAGFQRARDFSSIAQLDNFKSGTAAELPSALDAAGQQGSGYKTLGDILKGGSAIGYGVGAPGTAQWLSGQNWSSLLPNFGGPPTGPYTPYPVTTPIGSAGIGSA